MKIKFYTTRSVNDNDEGLVKSSEVVVEYNKLSSKIKKLINSTLSSDSDDIYNDLERELQNSGIIKPNDTLQAFIQVD